MKYKVGDKVRVRKDLNIDKWYGDYDCLEDMIEYKGREAIIEGVYCDTYDLDIDDGKYYWTDSMLEPVIENKQFTKKDFKFGDIVTLRNGIQGLITIEEVQYNDDTFNNRNDFNDDLTHITNDKNLDIIKVQRYIHYSQYGDTIYTLTTLYERKEEILDEKEKEYLGAVIRPFRDKVEYIVKNKSKIGYYISIDIDNIETIDFPYFYNDTMYKGMETNKKYTLEELGL